MKHLLLAFVGALALATGAAPGAPSEPLTVHIKNFAFQPATLTVHAGDQVTFVNDDDDAHTVTAVDRSFGSPGLDTGDHWTYAFKRTGKFAYICALHPYMKGTIIVLAATKSAAL